MKFFIIGRLVAFDPLGDFPHKSSAIISLALILLFDLFSVFVILCYLSMFVERMKYELKLV